MVKALKLPLLTSVVFALYGTPTYAEEWELKRDREGVQVYTKSVEGSQHKAVRSTMQSDRPVAELVALVMDATACPKWAALCKESRVAQEKSATELWVYTYNDLPWPVKDRDAVGHVVWTRDSDDQSINMTATIVDGIVEKTSKALRLHTGITRWKFTPNEQGTLIESYAHLDPGGATPAWLTNMLLVDSPYDTMIGMRDLVATDQYKDANIDFIE